MGGNYCYWNHLYLNNNSFYLHHKTYPSKTEGIMGHAQGSFQFFRLPVSKVWVYRQVCLWSQLFIHQFNKLINKFITFSYLWHHAYVYITVIYQCILFLIFFLLYLIYISEMSFVTRLNMRLCDDRPAPLQVTRGKMCLNDEFGGWFQNFYDKNKQANYI